METYRAAGIDIGGSHTVLTAAIAESEPALTVPIEVLHADIYRINVVLTRGPEYGQVELRTNSTGVGDTLRLLCC